MYSYQHKRNFMHVNIVPPNGFLVSSQFFVQTLGCNITGVFGTILAYLFMFTDY